MNQVSEDASASHISILEDIVFHSLNAWRTDGGLRCLNATKPKHLDVQQADSLPFLALSFKNRRALTILLSAVLEAANLTLEQKSMVASPECVPGSA